MKSKKITDVRYIFGHFFQDGDRHHFFIDFELMWTPFRMFFGDKIGKKGYQQTQQKHPCKKVTREIREFREWILWSLKTIQGSQIPGLVNLTKGLETLHWCLAARWRTWGWPIANSIRNIVPMLMASLKYFKSSRNERAPRLLLMKRTVLSLIPLICCRLSKGVCVCVCVREA